MLKATFGILDSLSESQEIVNDINDALQDVNLDDTEEPPQDTINF